MSRRTIRAAIADLRANGPSRRQLMAGSTLALTGAPSATDAAVEACHAWLEFEAEYEDLIKRWQAVEAHLIRHHNWRQLSRRQRAAMSESAELDAIDDRLDDLDDLKQALLSHLPATEATTSRGLVAKLCVLATVVHPQENAKAHDLVNSVLRDLRTIAGITSE